MSTPSKTVEPASVEKSTENALKKEIKAAVESDPAVQVLTQTLSKAEVTPSQPTTSKEKTDAPKPSTPAQFPKSKESSHIYTLKCKSGIQTITPMFQTPVATQTTPSEPKRASLLERTQIKYVLETDHGTPFIIDVQSDFRFPLLYFITNTMENYSSMYVKGFPYTSPFTIVAYQQIIYNAMFLIYDLYTRPTTSQDAKVFREDAVHRDFLTAILNLHVPPEIAMLITQLAPTSNPQRQSMMLIPTLACFCIESDMSRCVPPGIMLCIHKYFADLRSKTKTCDEAFAAFLSTPLARVGGIPTPISCFIGGIYQTADELRLYENWLVQRIYRLFSRYYGIALTMKPNYAKFAMESFVYEDDNDLNAYELMLGFTPNRHEVILDILHDVDSYFQTLNKPLVKLGSLVDSASGIAILTHSIEPVTLPTGHLQPAVPDRITVPTKVTAKTFATDMSFLAPFPTFTGTLNPANEKSDVTFYLIAVGASNPATDVIQPILFDEDKHVLPPVFWFQPFYRNPGIIQYSMILGIKIETESIDGVSIPLPTTLQSLSENNSQYLHGAIPLRKLKAYIPTPTPGEGLHLPIRRTHTTRTEPLSVAFRSTERNMLPQFATSGVRASTLLPSSLVPIKNISSRLHAFTYTGWSTDNEPPVDDDFFYLWSSYRHRMIASRREESIHFYFTMRPHYGLATVLSSTENPVSLMP